MTADTIGGVWTYSLDLARGLCSRGSKVVLATMGEGMSQIQRQEAVSIPGLQVVESTFKLEWMEDPWADVDAAGEWLLDLERHAEPEVVHLNGYAHGALPFRAPKMVVAHSCVLSWWAAVKGEPAPQQWTTYRERVQAGLRGARGIVAPTRAMLAALHEIYGALPPSRAIHNSRAPHQFTAKGSKRPIIFAAARLGDEAKNITALGRAAAKLRWGVFVAGSDSDPSGRTQLSRNVHHCGKLSSEGVARWMTSASIYCLPARYEPFGLSVLEAALAGCALVLGDIPSLRELWNGAAVFVPSDDPDRLHRELEELINDSGRRDKLAAAAQERAGHYSYERFIEGYLRAYQDLTREHHSPHLAAA